MNGSRVDNCFKNMFWGILTQVITFILQFVGRTIFVRVLGEDYLGINGLFTNIISVLNFVELGIGNAIVFSMYKPMAVDNKPVITALMKLYKIVSYATGIIVLLLGVLLTPFLPMILKDQPNISENIYFIYSLYLLCVVVSYFYCYKRSIITVAQKDYINILYQKTLYVIQVVLQMIVLVYTKNFILFLVVQVVCVLLYSFLTAKKADRMFPYINEKSSYELSSKETKPIVENVKALVLYKLANVIQTGTDNILISAIVGVRAVGITSNYVLITESVNKLVTQGTLGIAASVGNFNALESKEKQEDIFHQLLFITAWVYGFLSIGLLCCITPLIRVWFGEKYVFSYMIVFAMISNVYVTGLQFAPNTFRTTLGLLDIWKITPLICTVINLGLSIILGKFTGVFGILIATTISRLLTTNWVDVYILYKRYFHKSVWKIYLKYIGYTVVTLINYVIISKVLSYITVAGWSGVFVKAIVCTIMANTIYAIVYCRSKNFRAIYNRVKSMLNRGTRR